MHFGWLRTWGDFPIVDSRSGYNDYTKTKKDPQLTFLSYSTSQTSFPQHVNTNDMVLSVWTKSQGPRYQKGARSDDMG